MTRVMGPPLVIRALHKQIRLHTPMLAAKAAVITVPTLYNSLSVLADSWALALVWLLVIAVFSIIIVLLIEGFLLRLVSVTFLRLKIFQLSVDSFEETAHKV